MINLIVAIAILVIVVGAMARLRKILPSMLAPMRDPEAENYPTFKKRQELSRQRQERGHFEPLSEGG
jgi:hypothetical protein